MGVDTKALLHGRINVLDLAHDIVTLYGADRSNVKIGLTHDEEFLHIFFDHRYPANWKEMDYTTRKEWRTKNHRMMSVFYDCACDYSDVTEETCTLISLGCWGESVQIMESLLRKYGGWIMRNDSTDEWEVFSE